MNRIAAASGAFNAFGSVSCMLIVKHLDICHMEFALYQLIIIIIIIITLVAYILLLLLLLLLFICGCLSTYPLFVCLFAYLFGSHQKNPRFLYRVSYAELKLLVLMLCAPSNRRRPVVSVFS